MESLKNILNDTLKDLGLKRGVQKYQALEVWNEIVGPKVAEVTVPQTLTGGKLFIRVKSDVWRHELLYHLPDIIVQINQKVGIKAVEEIILI
jgi:predicted nucleic acid-binding Zn ribbon protein